MLARSATGADHLHLLHIHTTDENAALFLVAVGGPHKRSVRHARFHGVPARFDLDFGPAILAMGLDFAVAHIAFEVAFNFNALAEVLVELVVSVKPVEDRGESAARSH